MKKWLMLFVKFVHVSILILDCARNPFMLSSLNIVVLVRSTQKLFDGRGGNDVFRALAYFFFRLILFVFWHAMLQNCNICIHFGWQTRKTDFVSTYSSRPRFFVALVSSSPYLNFSFVLARFMFSINHQFTNTCKDW